MKRKPLLADRFLATPLTNYIKRKDQERIHSSLRAAKRFVLDDTAIRYAAELLRDVPEIVGAAQEYALLPFPVMYIEIPNFKLWWETITGRIADADADKEIGYLYVGPRAYTIVGDGTDARAKAPLISPLEYRLHTPFSIDEEMTLAQQIGISRLGLDAFFWGESIVKVAPEMTRALRQYHSAVALPRDFPYFDGSLSSQYNGSAGDLRNMVALLLFLNQTSKLRYETEIGAERAFVRAKPSTLLKHSVVSIKINPNPRIIKRLLQSSGGVWRREHDVRGHFCHDKTTRDHDHLHDFSEYDVNQWRCTECGGLRWWRNAHRRGHHEKGTVVTDYEVTK